MHSNDAEIAAGEWLARLDRDDPTPEVLSAFEQWKASDPRHAAAYARLEATWQALDRIRAIRPTADEAINDDYLKAALHDPESSPECSSPVAQETLVESPQESPLRPPRALSARHRAWIFASVAASLTAAVSGLWIAHSFGSPQTFTTGVGGFQRIVLADQSIIELNTDTEVRVALNPRLRKVELRRGEASFEVAHDTARPFIVSAGNTAVRAVGTKFDVRRLDDSVEVIVDEGRVLVGAPELLETPQVKVQPTMVPLSAGQMALGRGGALKLGPPANGSTARKLTWRNQMLVFDGDTLANVVTQFNRYNERQLVIADPSLASLQIGGYFRPTNLDAFISVLESDFGIRVSADGDRLMLATAADK